MFKLHSKQLQLLPASFVVYGLTVGQTAIAAEKQMLQFDIKAQRADLALIEFAKQTEQTVIFSFELAKQYQAHNRYLVFYTKLDALNAMLEGTELDAVVDQQGLR